MIDFADYWGILERNCPKIKAVANQDPRDSEGFVLARDAIAEWDVPRFTNSAMDGFAVAFDAIAGKDSIQIVGEQFAGQVSKEHQIGAVAIRIATGAVLPSGFDTIVPRENTVEDGQEIQLIEPPKAAGQHVRKQGEEIQRGEIVFPAGTKLTAAHIAALVSTGVSSVTVHERVRCAIVVTGDEVRTDRVEEHQIPDTNGLVLRSLFAGKLGLDCEVQYVGDNEVELLDTWSRLQDFDLIISTGGVSVGDKDFVRSSSVEAGFSEVLWRVAMKPGKPVYVARRDRQMLLGLPGNPAAVLAHFFVSVVPAVRLLEGNGSSHQGFVSKSTDSAWENKSRRSEMLWCRENSDGSLSPLPKQRSHMLVRAATAEYLAILPAGSTDVKTVQAMQV